MADGPNIPNDALDAARKQRVQNNAFSAALPAVLLLFYGFGFDPINELSVLLFSWTLKIGGIAFAIIAVISFVGVWHMLLVDALVSIVCGFVFGLTAAIWTVQGDLGMQTILNGVFGVMFVGAGYRSWMDYWRFAGAGMKATVAQSASPIATSEPLPDPGPAATATMQALKKVKRGEATHETPAPVVEEKPAPSPVAPKRETPVPPRPVTAPPPANPVKSTEPPPSGFLASFANEDEEDNK